MMESERLVKEMRKSVWKVCHAAADKIESLEQQLAEVNEKIVAKLPKTADGVVVFDGDAIWSTSERSTWGATVQWDHKRRSYGAFFRGIWRPVEECYSTPAAAEAARSLAQRKAE